MIRNWRLPIGFALLALAAVLVLGGCGMGGT